MSALTTREIEAVFRNPVDRAIGALFPGLQRRRIEARCAVALGYKAVSDMRTRRGSTAVGGDADAHARPWDLFKMREESRGMERSNCVMGGILGRTVDAVVRTGIGARAVTKDAGWNEEAQAAFVDGLDFYGRFEWWQLQRLALRSMHRDGDVGAVLTDSLQVQVLEAERLGTPIDLLGRSVKVNYEPVKIENGVEKTPDGAPVAYWVGKPIGGVGATIEHSRTARRIEAKDFIHLVDPDRFTASRGVPTCHAVIPLLDKLDEYIDVEMTGAKGAAMLTAFISQRNNDVIQEARGHQETNSDGDPVYYSKMRSGAIMYGAPGEGVDIISGERPNPNFDPFVMSLMRFIGMHYGVPLQLLLLDLSQTTFASAKTLLMLARFPWECQQELMADKWIRRLWSWRIGGLIRRGRLVTPGGKFLPRALECEMDPPGWPLVDVEKEVNANEKKIVNALDSLQRLTGETGQFWRDNLRLRREAILAAKAEAALCNDPSVTWRDFIGGTVSRRAAAQEGAAGGQEEGKKPEEDAA